MSINIRQNLSLWTFQVAYHHDCMSTASQWSFIFIFNGRNRDEYELGSRTLVDLGGKEKVAAPHNGVKPEAEHTGHFSTRLAGDELKEMQLPSSQHKRLAQLTLISKAVTSIPSP